MESRAPMIIVLALGAGTLGGPDALRLLLDLAGRRSPVVDIAICILVIGMLTAQLLGVALLARFVRKSPGADLFARMTLMVSVAVAFLVSACLLVTVSGGGLMSSVRSVFDFAGKSPVVAAAGFLLLLRILRQAGSGDDRVTAGNAAAAAPGTDTSRFLARLTTQVTTLAVVCLTLAYFSLFGGKSDGGKHACSA